MVSLLLQPTQSVLRATVQRLTNFCTYRNRNFHLRCRRQEASRRIRFPTVARGERGGGAGAEPPVPHMQLGRARGYPSALR